MIDLSSRSEKHELLDDPSVPFADIRQNMRELNIINSYLGGHKITVNGVKQILKKWPPNKLVTICEIGCGGGDNLNAIEKWCNKNSIDARFIGIDINRSCIEFARHQYPGLKANWIHSDYKLVNLEFNQPDIIFSSLFCHHFKDDAIIDMLQWMKKNARLGFFINDLHRHVLAYYSIKIITSAFSKSYLVKNDAPLSVARGFKLKEWKYLLKRAGINNDSVEWKWAFRHLIVYVND
ncbi:MAG: methyltransferase domain-containing protein [Ferruginibacter sp.]